MTWKVERIINYRQGEVWKDGYAQFGFHGASGKRYVLDNRNHWAGSIGPDNSLQWTAGSYIIMEGRPHISGSFLNPHYITERADGSLLLLCSGSKKIFALYPEEQRAAMFIDMENMGAADIGNCVPDGDGNLWVNEITGCRLWKFDQEGRFIEALGGGKPGFTPGTVSFEEVRFGWIYDMRPGPDGNIYILDSRNYCVRMLDPIRRTVSVAAGSGKGGYSGDGGDPLSADLGHNPGAHFDGPWAMCLDEAGNIFIGDTQNNVVRMVERKSSCIFTIAGSYGIRAASSKGSGEEDDPLKLRLPLISSMDYYCGRLFIPVWNNKLVILNRL